MDTKSRHLLLATATACGLLAVRASVTHADTPLTATVVHEAGPAAILQNDGEYGANGTRYNAGDVGQRKNLVVSQRTSVEVARGRHRLIFLYAPFEVTTEVTLGRALQFRDTNFAAGSVVAHRYLFDGYRASYLYRAVDRGAFKLEVGGSVQIRNAEVAFRTVDGTLRDAENDIGLVGAAKVRGWYQPQALGSWAALEFDGLSTFGLLSNVRGGIYDAQLMAGYPVARSVDLFVGARLLGGGADVKSKDIYNWANFVAFTLGVRVSLDELFGRRIGVFR